MNKFTVTENFYSQDILENVINKYVKFKTTDDHSDYWPAGAKNSGAEVKVEPVSDKDQMLLKEYLFTEDISIFKGFKPIKNATFTVFKAKPGFILSEHVDNCVASLTVFINPEATSDYGGEFFWIDDSGKEHIVNNRYNTAIQWKSPLGNSISFSPAHGTLVNKKERFVMQMFVKNIMSTWPQI